MSDKMKWAKAKSRDQVRASQHEYVPVAPDEVVEEATIDRDIIMCKCGATRSSFASRAQFLDHRDLCDPGWADRLHEEIPTVNDTDEYTRLAILQGFTVEKLGSGHLRFTAPGGDSTVIPSTGASHGHSSATTRKRLERIGMRFDKGAVRRARKAARRASQESVTSTPSPDGSSSSTTQNGTNGLEPNPAEMRAGQADVEENLTLAGTTRKRAFPGTAPGAVDCPNPRCHARPSTVGNLTTHMKNLHPRWTAIKVGSRTVGWKSPNGKQYPAPGHAVIAEPTRIATHDRSGQDVPNLRPIRDRAGAHLVTPDPEPAPEPAPEPPPAAPIAHAAQGAVESRLEAVMAVVWPDGLPLDADTMMLAATWVADTRKFLEDLAKLEA